MRPVGLPSPRSWAAALLLGICGVLLYAHTLQAPWYLDDYAVIVDYPGVSQIPLSLPQFLAPRGPVLLSFVLNYRWGGFDPWGYHLVNIGLHLITAWLVYLLLLRAVAARRWLALLAALVFVAHPLQTQTVNYVVQRMTGLAALLALLALWLFVRFLESGGGAARRPEPRHWALYGAALAAGGLAVLTKQNVAVLPGLLYLFERLLLRTGIPRRRLLWLIAPFALVPAWLGVTTLLLPLLQGSSLNTLTSLNAAGLAGDVTPLNYLFTQFKVVWIYLRLMVLPLGQALDYNYPLVSGLTDPLALLGLAGLLLLLALAWWLRRRRPLLSFALAWFLVCLSVESTIIPLDPLFEHRLYLPMFGFCVALCELARRFPERTGACLLVLLLAVFLPLTWQRNALWTDKVAFLNDNLAKAPRSERIMNNLAIHYIENGQPALGEPLLRRILELNPQRHDEYGNLALLYLDLGNIPAALEFSRRGLVRFPANERLQTAYGLALILKGEVEEGLVWMRRAVAMAPHFSYGLAELGRVLARLGRFEESVYWLSRALNTIAVDASLHYDLATSLQKLGRFEEARREYLLAVELDPGNPLYLMYYGLISAKLGNDGAAMAMLSRLESLDAQRAAELRAEVVTSRREGAR